MAFAATHGCGALLVANLWAWRATDPRELARVEDPVGPENDASITEALSSCTGPVVVGWGTRAEPGRVEVVLGLLAGRPLLCLGTTRDAHPRHPLYVAATTRLRAW